MVGVFPPEKYPEPEPNTSHTKCRPLACRSESRLHPARSRSRQAACGDCLDQMGYGLASCTLKGYFMVHCCVCRGAWWPVRHFELRSRQVCGHRRACRPIIGVSLIAPNSLIFFDFGPEDLNVGPTRLVTVA